MTDADLTGRVVLLTGATSGIGREAARELGGLGATVLVHGRDRERGRRTVEEVERAGGAAEFLRADFADLDAVRDLSREVCDRYDRLDVLVNNAGIYRRERELTDDGFEVTFAVNHLAPFLLTHELAAALVAGAPARVVTTASGAHRQGTIHFDDLGLEDYGGMEAYSQSKLANVLFTYELADRLRGTGVTANAFHPGFVPGSRLFRVAPLPVRVGLRLFSLVPGVTKSTEAGARTLVYLAASPEVADVTGKYFADERERRSSPESYDEDVRRRLWEASADLVGVDPELSVETAAPDD